MLKKENILKKAKKELPLIITLLLIVILLLIPTGFEKANTYSGTESCTAKVLEVDNSSIWTIGVIQSGEQRCVVKVTSGKFKGQTITGVNLLTGSLETDKFFEVGDKVQIRISYDEGIILSASIIDHYRINKEIFLAVIFIIFLIIFAGKTGVKSILSFVLTVLAIWKVLVPCYLKGQNPVLLGLLIVCGLTILIISLVYGFEKKSLSAISGSVLGIITTAVLGMTFTDMFKIHGAIMPNSESLLYAGYANLDLTKIYMATIFIGSSGALMDIAVDITSAVNEVVEKKPDISFKEATKSGLNVGRAAMGTMTTTLLLAYSGGYIALLMVFMAQGTPIENILNYKYISAEIADTIIGSFGLVAVAPFTALTSGFFLTRKKKPETSLNEQ